MELRGVAVTIYFGSKDNYDVFPFEGTKKQAKKFVTSLIEQRKVVEIEGRSINFSLVTEFEVKDHA